MSPRRLSSSGWSLRLGPTLGAGLVLCALASVYWWLDTAGVLRTITDKQVMLEWVTRLGLLGPLIIILSMTLAILISPIPSAPIALAAGAAYGHTWGTLYVILGAEAGALAAFGVARLVGHDVLQRWFGGRLSVGLFGSQNALMGVVFVSRVLPFMSFDMVSYAAGLTAISTWRFALATLAGITPISFLLAHFGSGMATGDTDRVLLSALALGVLTLIPVLAELLRERIAGQRGNKTRNQK